MPHPDARQPIDSPPEQQRARRIGQSTAALVLLAALVVGIQLGAIPWRYRKQIWQLQGALVGLAAGFALGRISAGGAPPE